MVAHSGLTGGELHECKGADAASINTVRVSNGSGGGAWQKISSSNIDATSVKNVNKQTFSVGPVDPSVITILYIPIEQTKTLTSIVSIVNNTVAGNLTATIKKNSSDIGTIVTASTVEGTSGSFSTTTSFTTSDTLNIAFSGTSTSTVTLLFTFSL